MSSFQALSLIPLMGTIFMSLFPALLIYQWLKRQFKEQLKRSAWWRWGLVIAGVFIWASLHDFIGTMMYLVLLGVHFDNVVFFILPPAMIIILIIEIIVWWKITQKWTREDIDKENKF